MDVLRLQLLGPALASLLLPTCVHSSSSLWTASSVPLSLETLAPGQPAQATPTGKGASGARAQHCPDGMWRRCQGDGGREASAPAHQDTARLLPKAAAGLSEAGGGQAASSQDRPPTRHIRASGLSPGTARLRPLALTRNTPPYGLPQGG